MKPRQVSKRSAKPCPTGKRRYRDRTEAKTVLHGFAELSTREVKPVRVYLCPMCKGWHLTSQPDRHAQLANA